MATLSEAYAQVAQNREQIELAKQQASQRESNADYMRRVLTTQSALRREDALGLAKRQAGLKSIGLESAETAAERARIQAEEDKLIAYEGGLKAIEEKMRQQQEQQDRAATIRKLQYQNPDAAYLELTKKERQSITKQVEDTISSITEDMAGGSGKFNEQTGYFEALPGRDLTSEEITSLKNKLYAGEKFRVTDVIKDYPVQTTETRFTEAPMLGAIRSVDYVSPKEMQRGISVEIKPSFSVNKGLLPRDLRPKVITAGSGGAIAAGVTWYESSPIPKQFERFSQKFTETTGQVFDYGFSKASKYGNIGLLPRETRPTVFTGGFAANPKAFSMQAKVEQRMSSNAELQKQLNQALVDYNAKYGGRALTPEEYSQATKEGKELDDVKVILDNELLNIQKAEAKVTKEFEMGSGFGYSALKAGTTTFVSGAALFFPSLVAKPVSTFTKMPGDIFALAVGFKERPASTTGTVVGIAALGFLGGAKTEKVIKGRESMVGEFSLSKSKAILRGVDDFGNKKFDIVEQGYINLLNPKTRDVIGKVKVGIVSKSTVIPEVFGSTIESLDIFLAGRRTKNLNLSQNLRLFISGNKATLGMIDESGIVSGTIKGTMKEVGKYKSPFGNILSMERLSMEKVSKFRKQPTFDIFGNVEIKIKSIKPETRIFKKRFYSIVVEGEKTTFISKSLQDVLPIKERVKYVQKYERPLSVNVGGVNLKGFKLRTKSNIQYLRKPSFKAKKTLYGNRGLNVNLKGTSFEPKPSDVDINPPKDIELSSGRQNTIQVEPKQAQVLQPKAQTLALATSASKLGSVAKLLAKEMQVQLLQPKVTVTTTTTPATQLMQVTSQSQLQQQRQREQTKQVTSPALLKLERASQVSITKNLPRTTGATITTQVSREMLRSGFGLGSSTLPALATPQKQELQLRTKLVSREVTVSPSPVSPAGIGGLTRAPVITTTRSPKTLSVTSTSTKGLKEAFQVLIKRRGKYTKLAEGLPLGKALKAGAEYTKSTLASTFRLERKGTTSISDITYKPSEQLFRTYKITRGRKVSLPQGKDVYEFIEKKPMRLSTGGERAEIKMFKSSAARRKKIWTIKGK